METEEAISEPQNSGQTTIDDGRLKKVLDELEFIGFGMRGFRNTIFCFSLIQVVLLILPGLSHGNRIPWFYCINCAIIIVFLMLFDIARQQGNTRFEEISDEMQWRIRGNSKTTDGKEQPLRNRPNIEVRTTLRSFVESSDMLLISGKYGAIIYAVINIGLLACYVTANRL